MLYCDEGFQSFMEEEIGVFEYQYPKANILVRYMSETEAINSLLADSCNLIVTTTPLNQTQKDYIKSHNRHIVNSMPIAVDAVALIVNKKNNVERLTTTEIREILTGEIRNWNQLMRTSAEGVLDTAQIKIVFDRMGSATVNYMQTEFLNGGNFPPNAYAQATSMEVFKIVEQDPNAIGILSVSWLGENLELASSDEVKQKLDEKAIQSLENENEIIEQEFTDRIRIISVGGPEAVMKDQFYQPYQSYIYEKDKYPLVRTIYISSASGQGTVGKTFFDFVTGFIGQKILTRTGVLPYKVAPRIVELN